ncbi:RHS repeat-associated core domain-containing protein [Undibacterium sp. Xuan67W]|uniref:RHS repeat-associated core domain-containing protein n=1 Tax=Undibacterium sp. Xuan67W TaxID=3413057 RepID=UPI003BEFA2E3
MANENPQNTGVANNFSFNLRFPGQYFDKETGLHYNYFRDYEPSTGRYVESDPIGLDGGINTFGYVFGNPVALTDSMGLQSYMCSSAGLSAWCEPPKPKCISKKWADGISGAAGGAVGGAVGGGGWPGFFAGGVIGGIGSYYASGNGTPSISAAGAGAGAGGAIGSGLPGIIGGVISGGMGNWMGDVSSSSNPNTAGGAVGGTVGGIVTGILTKKGGFNFILNVYSGIKGGVVGGITQDLVNLILSGYICPPEPECKK